METLPLFTQALTLTHVTALNLIRQVMTQDRSLAHISKVESYHSQP